MRTDPDRPGRGLPHFGRRLGGSLLARLALANMAVVIAAVVVAGFGVRQFASMVIVQGDMMTMDRLPEFLSQTRFWLVGVSLLTTAAAALVAWLLFRQIMGPLLRMEAVTAAVAAGDYSQRLGERRPDELGRLARAIDSMTGSLAQVEQMRRDLVANIAHELRTPLTSTQGLLCAMRDGLLEPNEKNLEAAAEELARLTRLVEALHQLSVSDTVPRGGLQLEPIDLGDLAASVTDGMMPLFEQKQITVTVKTEPAAIMGNRDALVQVLVNLLDNAAKYTPVGGWVRVIAPGDATLTIANSGPGIDPADLPRIFERFYRGEKSRSRETGGAGIGLAIVQNLVEAHGGTVTAHSDGEGTSLIVRLKRPGER